MPKRALAQAHITVNKNAIPNDPEKPFVTSGIRIGCPAMTTRGFKELEAEQLGHLIADVLEAPRRQGGARARRREVEGALARSFPSTGDRDERSGIRRSDDRAVPRRAVPSALIPTSTRHEMPLLQLHGHPGHRLARERGGRFHPPPPPLPGVQQALHHLRNGGAAHAAGGEDRTACARTSTSRSCAPASCARCTSARCPPSSWTQAIDRIVHEGARARRARDRVAPARRDGDAGAATSSTRSPISASRRSTAASRTSTISATRSREVEAPPKRARR